MFRKIYGVAVLLLSVSGVCSAGNSYIVPTTTLTALTSNNTSAANSFTSQTNGNRGAGNVSKVNIHSLLYGGATTKVYAHLLLWFGQSNHMNVGYSSTDPAQIHRQIVDMISRGIEGVIIDWYGPNNSIDTATQLVMAEAEKHPGFTFAIMVDQGAIKWDSCHGCTPQQALIAQLQYVEQTYFPSPAYMTIHGQPMVTNFNIDLAYSIDWNTVDAALSTHPLFLFQNNDGFTHTLSKGSYSWVMPTTTDYGMSYLTSFYDTGMTYSTEQTVGASYKGFNDTLASWGSNRVMKQRCGQTWLQTFSKINSLYRSGKQLADLQLVTWNDYEEGTEIETGIDNCFAISASASSTSLQWSIGGAESTIAHYTVYISSDGMNLMPLTSVATGLHSLNLCSFPIPAGSYKLFVQAVGKPTLANHITASLSYTPDCASIAGGPGLSFTATPSALTISPGQSRNFTVTATPQSGPFNSTISLSCVGLPASLSCNFSPASLSPGSGSASSSVAISSVTIGRMNGLARKPSWIDATMLLPFGIAGFALSGKMQRRRRRSGLHAVALVGLIGISFCGISCGGKSANTQSFAIPVTYSVTVSGNSSAAQFSTIVAVTVR